MQITELKVTIGEVCEGYINDAEEGVVGYDERLDIRPKYQREFVYKDKQRDEVIRTVMKGLPLNVIYWCKVKKEDGSDGFEVLDGQQRTISVCEYVDGTFSVDDKYFYDAATGETFRKIGKTDIHIEFDNKAAFIGECKIWHGIKLFQSAVQQVINYSTWRDLKVSVIIFNKVNQSFQQILSAIKSWVDMNAVSYVQPQANIWKCSYHRPDMNVDIQLTILAFDLYVDKSQFKDSRYNN